MFENGLFQTYDIKTNFLNANKENNDPQILFYFRKCVWHFSKHARHIRQKRQIFWTLITAIRQYIQYDICYHYKSLGNWSEMHPCTCIDGVSELFYWMLLVTPKPPFRMYHFEIKLYIPNSAFGKKMMPVKSCHFLSMFGSSSDCCLYTLDHDRRVDHILSNNRTYILLFSCAKKGIVPVFSNEYIFWFCITCKFKKV